MSTTTSKSSAPTYLTPIAPDQPIGQDTEGRQIYGSFYFTQMIQRILSTLGQPTTSSSSGGKSGLSVTDQITELQEQVTALQSTSGAETVGIFPRLAALESMVRLLRLRPAAPAPRPARQFFPAPPSRTTISVGVRWLAGQNPNNLVVFTAQVPCIVTSITGRLEIAQGGTATLSLVKAASGTAISSGTALHSGSFNANGTAATDQTLTLAAFPTVGLNAGDSIGVQTTGTWTTSTGGLTVTLQY